MIWKKHCFLLPWLKSKGHKGTEAKVIVVKANGTAQCSSWDRIYPTKFLLHGCNYITWAAKKILWELFCLDRNVKCCGISKFSAANTNTNTINYMLWHARFLFSATLAIFHVFKMVVLMTLILNMTQKNWYNDFNKSKITFILSSKKFSKND